jgi:serine/threonine protein kinase/formylglycine-generating enzyme required for sulfatase activity
MKAHEPALREESLFLQALEIDSPDERVAFLDRACAGDIALRNGVEALLRHHRESTSFLESSPTEVVVAAEQLTAGEAEGPALDFLSPSNDAHSLGRLGYYDVLEVLGHGGFGVVLKARDTKLDRIVAVKTLAQSLASSATARKRFVREAKAAAAVKHENVVGIYHVSDEGPVPYLVMECVSGVSLETKLKQVGTLDLPAILRIGMQVASGLAAAHQQGLVHRDVKPGNILLENGVERVKITDFGLARAADDVAITRTGEVAGTPQYMSPEQAQGLSLDARSDLFSLGSVLYAMGTGRSPFRADSTVAVLRRVCDDTPRPIREINSDIPDWLADIIDRLLAKKPVERFQTAAEVAELLGQHLAQLQQPSPPAAQAALASQSKIQNSKSRISARYWVLSTVSALLLLLLTISVSLTEATGLTRFAPTLLRIVTGEGTLLVEVNDPAVKVTVEGDGGLVIRGAGVHEVHLKPGNYRWKATRDGQVVKQELVEIIRGGTRTIRVTRENAGQTTALRDNQFVSETNAPASEVMARQELCARRLGVPVEITNSVGMRLRLIPPGEFLMGTTENEVAEVCKRLEAQGELAFIIDCVRTEHRPRQVVIAEPFYASASEVTVGQFKRFVSESDYRTDGERANVGGFGHGPGGWERRPEHQWQKPGGWEPSDDQPVVQVSWNDAQAFCAWLGKCEGRTYTLPTEAQWEYAARAGTTARYGEGDGLGAIDAVGWVRGNLPTSHPDRPQPVAQKRPNAFGLCDTLGNVWEWCADPFQEGDRRRAVRGGTWYSSADHARFGSRGAHEPDVAADAGTGFRVILVGDLKSSRSADPDLPFVVLARNNRAEQKRATLAEAVLKSSEGDTIEVRGNGPFVSQPVKIAATPLTIRAGQGFRPVIRLDLKEAQAGDALLETRGTLCVEGVELQAIGPPSQDVKPYWSVLLHAIGADARLFVTNCRFVPNHVGSMPIRAAQVALLDVRNSQFVSQSCLAYSPARDSRISLHHNLIAADPFALSFPVFVPDAGKVAVTLQRNTLIAPNAVQLNLDFMPEAVEEPEKEEIKAIRIQASGNLFQGAASVLRFEQSSWFQEKHQALSGAEMETMLRDMVDWRGERNGFPSNTHLIELAALGKALPSAQPTDSVAHWNAFWRIADTQCLQGPIRFVGGDLLEKSRTTPELLTPEDHRLHVDGAGYQAGKDGKDLGADVDRVGPGPAYEQWKREAEYQDWLQASGQVK